MPHSRRPCEFDKDHLKALLKEESHQTSRELAKKMNCNQNMILNHLYSMGFAEKLGVWVPHELSKINKENCLQIASQHFTHHQATHSHKQRFWMMMMMIMIFYSCLVTLLSNMQCTIKHENFCTESSQEMRNGIYI